MRLVISALSLVPLLAGCAPPSMIAPDQPSHESTATINKPYDETWLATVDWFSNQNIPIKQIEKDSGLIASDYSLRTEQDVLDCGKVAGADGWTLTGSSHNANLNVRVRELGEDQSAVTMRIFGTGEYGFFNPMLSSPHRLHVEDCVSSGALEAQLFEAVSQ